MGDVSKETESGETKAKDQRAPSSPFDDGMELMEEELLKAKVKL